MTTFTKRIAAGADDCYNNGSTSFAGTTTNILMGRNSSGGSQDGGFRFTNVTVPKGATINSAKITLRANGDRTSTTVNLRISGVDADNFGGFSDSTGNEPYDATITTAYTDWNNIGSWTSGSDYDTPDIKTSVQEIVDRAGWSSGNAMAFVMRNNAGSINANRNASPYELTTDYCALLTIDYTESITFIPQITFI
jgi:hypothetical protein